MLSDPHWWVNSYDPPHQTGHVILHISITDVMWPTFSCWASLSCWWLRSRSRRCCCTCSCWASLSRRALCLSSSRSFTISANCCLWCARAALSSSQTPASCSSRSAILWRETDKPRRVYWVSDVSGALNSVRPCGSKAGEGELQHKAYSFFLLNLGWAGGKVLFLFI